jgi:oxygen-dependent protoporphyrinogen oxidase
MSFSTSYRVIIIGGGITGLAAAHRLVELSREAKRPLDIRLLEASARVGGVIETHWRDGFLLESGPDSFITDKPWALDLCQRLGIDDQLIGITPENRRGFIVRGNRLHEVPEGFYLLAPSRILPFLKSPIVSWRGKLRMGMDLLLPKRADGREESLAEFVTRRLGREALERVAQPMVGGIYTADPRKLSVQATMPRFLEMEAQHRSLILAMMRSRKHSGAQSASGPRYGLFASFKRGMQTLTDALVARLPKDTVRLGEQVVALEEAGAPSGAQWRVYTRTGKTHEADAVCVTLPSYEIARLLERIAPQLSFELREIPYSSVATLNLGYRRDDVPHPLNGSGFVVPAIEKRAILACTFCSSKYEGRAAPGGVLLRAFIGGAMFPEQLQKDDDAIIAAARDDLKRLLGVTAAPWIVELNRHPFSMTQYHVGHLARLERIQQLAQTLPHFYLTTSSVEGVGIPGCIHRGEQVAEKIFAAATD